MRILKKAPDQMSGKLLTITLSGLPIVPRSSPARLDIRIGDELSVFFMMPARLILLFRGDFMGRGSVLITVPLVHGRRCPDIEASLATQMDVFLRLQSPAIMAVCPME